MNRAARAAEAHRLSSAERASADRGRRFRARLFTASFSRARGQRIELRPGAPCSCRVRADGDLLRRVLQNLVDNALRHSPARGAVHVEARRRDARWVEVVVRG
ncbi:ATP-binding protein [Sorangium sp. So ce388]|uniref:ATP-binding protein n=1 Tax=Sorangium sp. So ce388 TaxID=3133309 RepID=UPI003F5C9723